MGTASIQAQLWGARAHDYAANVEWMFRPIYERVFDEASVGMGTRLLTLAAGQDWPPIWLPSVGRVCSGLDAAEASLAIARGRTPAGDFRCGEMEELPWPDAAFDVVTSFNAIQFAANPVNALQEARRVTQAGGRVAVVVWGRDEDVELTVTMAALRSLLPPAPPGAAPTIPLAAPGLVESLLEQAGLTPLTGGDVECPFEFPDLDTAVRAIMSSGVGVAAIRQVGAEAVAQAVAQSLAVYVTGEGGYRQRNKLRYVIAAV